MKSIDRYARKQVILDNLEYSLWDLNNQRLIVIDQLFKIDKQISKHEEYLDRLSKEED